MTDSRYRKTRWRNEHPESPYPIAVHRLVWERAHGTLATGLVIHHLDGDPANNALDNLYACTSSEHNRLHRGWEHREDGWWKPSPTGMVPHTDTAKRAAAVQVVRRDYFEAVLGTIREPYRTMMLLQWAVGLRPGEACKMRVADLDLATGDLVTPRDGKTGERRLCFDTAGKCADALREWVKIRPHGPYLFGGEQPIRVNTYNITVHRACRRAGVPEFRPYALRHTYATDLIHERQAISDVSAALGHRNVLTTAQYYLHADPEMLRRLNKGR